MITLDDLADLPIWGSWRNQNGVKVPYSIDGRRASTTNPHGWSTRAEAARYRRRGEQEAINLTETPYGCLCGLDLDSCLDQQTGALDPWAQSIIDDLATYAEISPSGTGVKLFFLAAPGLVAELREKLGKWGRSWKRASTGGHPPAIELYLRDRYFAVTSRALNGAVLTELTHDQLQALIEYGAKFARKDDGGSKGSGADQSRSGKAFRKGCELKAKGYSYEEMRDALLADEDREIAEWTRTKGLASGEREMRRIYDNAGLDEAPCLKGERFTDLGNARRLVRFYGTDIRYVAHFNAWYIWEGHYWRRDEDGAIMRLAKATIEKLFAEAAKIEDETPRTVMRKFALASQSCARLAAMVKLAESELPIVLSHERLDADPMLLGVKNGVIELETGQFREGRREDYITKRCDVAYDPRAICPQWCEFQATIAGHDKDLIAYKQRLAGVFLTGKCIEVLFIPWGSGSNGKSTELETYQAILADYGHAADASLLLARKETAGPTPEIVELKGKRAIFINETPERAHLNEARVKYLTGNDTMSGRGLHERPINFRPTHKVVMRTNHKPIIRGTDLGIWRRINLIPYLITIASGDPDFRQCKLMPELPGILNWMLEGLKVYQREGLNPPKAVCDATDRYKADMDLLAQWLADRCILDRDSPAGGPQSETLLKELTADFNVWARDDLRRPWPNATLSEKLSELGLEIRRTTPGMAVSGIKLKPRNGDLGL
jgi:putative DNA primase/helicase